VTRLAAALTRLADGGTDLVLLDLGLPDSQGLATLHALRNVAADVPIIVLTGNDDEELAVAAAREGAQDYLVKGQLGSGLLVRALRYARERKRTELALQESLHEKESLLREIHHRVKNNLQIISSLLRLQCERIDHPIARAALQDMQNRVHSMALIHELLYGSGNMAEVDLSIYLGSLCRKLFHTLAPADGTLQLQLNLAPVLMKINHAIPCGLLVNELVTNALKHAFPAGQQGEVRVDLQALADDPDGWRLRVADNGTGLPPGLDMDNLTTLGMKLITSLARQIGGRLTIGPGPGAVLEVEFRAG